MCDVTGVSRARAGESNNEKVTSTLPVRAGSNMHKTEREREREKMLSGAQPVMRSAVVKPLVSSDRPQTYPEGDGEEPGGCSDLTGSGVRSKGMVSNECLGNEMRTVSKHDGWRTRNVRVIRLLQLLFLPQRKAPLEDLDPGCWRESCELVVENFQDVILRTHNLPSCPRSVQRRCVVGLASVEESCYCRKQISKWASVPWILSLPGTCFVQKCRLRQPGRDVEDVNDVVLPFRPHMSELHELKKVIPSVAPIVLQASVCDEQLVSIGGEIALSGSTPPYQRHRSRHSVRS